MENSFQPYQFNYYPTPKMQPKHYNNLTPKEIKKIQKQMSSLNIKFTEEEILRSICNHRSIDGMSDTLVYDMGTGIARCTICGEEFSPIDPKEELENIKKKTQDVIDILQTVKLFYMDFPIEVARDFFPIIKLLEKIPELFELSVKSFNKHEFETWTFNNHNKGGIAMSHSLQNSCPLPNFPHIPSDLYISNPPDTNQNQKIVDNKDNIKKRKKKKKFKK